MLEISGLADTCQPIQMTRVTSTRSSGSYTRKVTRPACPNGRVRSGSGLSVGSLSYVSRTVGWLVAGQVKASQQVPTDSLLRTSDAGLTWSLVRF